MRWLLSVILALPLPLFACPSAKVVVQKQAVAVQTAVVTPVLAATADTALGATAPATTVALVPIVNCIYAYVD